MLAGGLSARRWQPVVLLLALVAVLPAWSNEAINPDDILANLARQKASIPSDVLADLERKKAEVKRGVRNKLGAALSEKLKQGATGLEAKPADSSQKAKPGLDTFAADLKEKMAAATARKEGAAAAGQKAEGGKEKKNKKVKKEAAPTEKKVAPGEAKGKDKKGFEWPDSQMGPRTSERVSAGKRAAKWISCRVCEERMISMLPPNFEIEEVDTFFGGLVNLDDVKELCKMRDLAGLFKSRKLEIVTSPDGSAKIAKTEGNTPTYDEINTSELAFHWKSFAVQHACMEVFRKDGDAIAKALKESYAEIRPTWNEAGGEDDNKQFFPTLGKVMRQSCQKAKMCKAQLKLTARGGQDEL